MAERRKIRVLSAVLRNTRRDRRSGESWPGDADALTALARAWAAVILASALFAGAVALSQVWDGPVFLRALDDTLRHDPQLAPPGDPGPTGGTDPWTK